SKRRGPQSDLRHPLRIGQRSARLAGKPDTGLLAEAERAQSVDQLLLAQTLADLRRADVRRLPQHGRGSGPVYRMRVVDLLPGARPGTVLVVEDLVGAQHSLVDVAGEHEPRD